MPFWTIWTTLTLQGWIRSNLCPSSCHRARPPVWSRGITDAPRSRHQDIQSGDLINAGRNASMDKAEIPFLSVSQLSELIKSRQVSPVEVVEGYLERIDRLNDRLYAYLTVCRDQAVEAARALERELARGAYRGPLHGVPVAAKDQ